MVVESFSNQEFSNRIVPWVWTEITINADLFLTIHIFWVNEDCESFWKYIFSMAFKWKQYLITRFLYLFNHKRKYLEYLVNKQKIARITIETLRHSQIDLISRVSNKMLTNCISSELKMGKGSWKNPGQQLVYYIIES